MTRPPEVVSAPNYPIDCTSSRAAPILDTICTGYFIANGIVLATAQDCSTASFGQSCINSSTKAGGLLVSGGLALLCGFSAGAGYGQADRCQEKKDLNALCITGDQRACRTLRPGWAPAPAGGPGQNVEVPAPEPGRGCTKDTDCKGDRICVSGTCMSPSSPVPPARPPREPPPERVPPPRQEPPASTRPRCDTSSDCLEGICIEGFCRK